MAAGRMLCAVAALLSPLALFSCVEGHSAAASHNALAMLRHMSFVDEPVDNSTFTVTANVTENLESGQPINVTVTTTGERTKHEWLAMYTVDSRSIVDKTPVAYAFLRYDPDYYATGVASLLLKPVNMRTKFEFVVYSCAMHKHNTCSPVARPAMQLSFADPDAPSVPRVLITSDPSRMKISWTSGNATAPMLWLRKEPSSSWREFMATTSTLAASEMCDEPAVSWGFHDLGLLHTVELTGIIPDTQYSYKIFSDPATPARELFQFRSGPPVGSDQSLTALVVGDLGRATGDDTHTWNEYGAPAIHTVATMSKEADARVFFHIGDLSYATGFLATWDEYLYMMQPLTSKVPYAIALGNHESDSPWASFPEGRTPTIYTYTDSGGECGVPSDKLYPMPWGGPDAPWYSFNMGPVHFVTMSTEHDYSRGSEQWEWLKRDLSSVNRSDTPWVVFGGHRPMYIDSTYDTALNSSDQAAARLLREHVEPLMVGTVDVAFWGHNHAYQRLSAALNGTSTQHSIVQDGFHTFVQSDAPVHCVIGTGGASFTKNQMQDPPSYSESVLYEFGYLRLEATGDQELSWTFISSYNESVLDAVRIIKKHSHEQPSEDNTLWYALGGGAAGCVVLAAALFFTCRGRRLGARSTDEADGHVRLTATSDSKGYASTIGDGV